MLIGRAYVVLAVVAVGALVACGGGNDGAATFDVTIHGNGSVIFGATHIDCTGATATCTDTLIASPTEVTAQLPVFARSSDLDTVAVSLTAGAVTAGQLDASGAVDLALPADGTPIVATFAALTGCTPTATLAGPPSIAKIGVGDNLTSEVCAGHGIAIQGAGLVDPTTSPETGGAAGTCFYVNRIPTEPTAWNSNSASGEQAVNVPDSGDGPASLIVRTTAGRAIGGFSIVDFSGPTIASVSPSTAAAGAAITIRGSETDHPGFAVLVGQTASFQIPLTSHDATTATFGAFADPGTYTVALADACGETSLSNGPQLVVQ